MVGCSVVVRFIALCMQSALLGLLLGPFAQASDLVEEIVTVKTPSGHQQAGVLGISGSGSRPTKLLVIVSGHPGVTRPFVNAIGRIQTKQDGNFLVRSRKYLVSETIATLLLDCRSDFETLCTDEYQASVGRTEDIQLLVDQVRQRVSSLSEVWVISTSRGVITTAGIAKHAPDRYRGVIHTAGTYGKAIDQGVRFERTSVSQYFVHHKDDPCAMTLHEHAVALTSKNRYPLVTVFGGSGFRGQPCQAFTQHGFTGQEEKVARAIRGLVETGRLESTTIE
jgi:hypothetical protein